MTTIHDIIRLATDGCPIADVIPFPCAICNGTHWTPGPVSDECPVCGPAPDTIPMPVAADEPVILPVRPVPVGDARDGFLAAADAPAPDLPTLEYQSLGGEWCPVVRVCVAARIGRTLYVLFVYEMPGSGAWLPGYETIYQPGRCKAFRTDGPSVEAAVWQWADLPLVNGVPVKRT